MLQACALTPAVLPADAFLQDLTSRFAHGDFVEETRAWFAGLESPDVDVGGRASWAGGNATMLSMAQLEKQEQEHKAVALKAAAGWEAEAVKLKLQLDKDCARVRDNEEVSPEERLVTFARSHSPPALMCECTVLVQFTFMRAHCA